MTEELLQEIGRTVRAALADWHRTLRLAFLLTVTAAIGSGSYLLIQFGSRFGL
ncbi:hypothetical protein [Streptomyces sp. NPDC003077]|uniref:hypothetical protein n=1 Tax=Streptomyces sp. NPDC003077 TaxID=3154443 RepID=UPI0033A51BF5